MLRGRAEQYFGPVLHESRLNIAVISCKRILAERGEMVLRVYLNLALCEYAKRWLLAASGTMDSHLHAVSGVGSCSQRSQAESKTLPY